MPAEPACVSYIGKNERAIALGIGFCEEFTMAVPIVMAKKKHILYTAAFLSGLAGPF